MNYYIVSNELYHHGILGQKWGVRRYQNPDGSLTAAGRERYAKQVSNEIIKAHNRGYRSNESPSDKIRNTKFYKDMLSKMDTYDAKTNKKYISDCNRLTKKLSSNNSENNRQDANDLFNSMRSSLGNRNYNKAQDLIYEELGSKYGNKRIPGTPFTIVDALCGMLTENAYGEELMQARTVLQSALNDAELEAEYERATKEWKIKK